MKHILLIIMLTPVFAVAQSNSESFRKEIVSSEYLLKNDIKEPFSRHDISKLLTQTTNSRIFGFIGTDFQRIRIKFISVIKDPGNPRQYFVYGKTMVKQNICDFQGTITITGVYNVKTPEYAGLNQGTAIGEYLFYEDPAQKHVGVFTGVFRTNWYIDEEGNLKYDDLAAVADGFSNNEFVGTWTSYSGAVTKPCNWGDNRIPMSAALDTGAGEFYPDTQYHKNGWQTYVDAYSGGNDLQRIQQAQQTENEPWWK